MRTRRDAHRKVEFALRSLIAKRGFGGFRPFGRSIGVDRGTLRLACKGRELAPRTAEAIAKGLGIAVSDLARLGLRVRESRPSETDGLGGLVARIDGGAS